MTGLPCRDKRDNCVSNKYGACIALNNTSWINDTCSFYCSPERYTREMELIKKRTGGART